jgi:undecaprenyl-diphosphatase
MDKVILFFGSYLAYILIAFFIGIVLISHYSRIEKLYILGETAASALIARFGVTELIRLFIHRPRPFLVEHPVHQLLTDPAWSFPSGHATFFFAMATTIYLYHKKWGVFFYIMAALVSLGRVASGVHYPSDIIAGAAVGTLTAYGIFALVRKIRI